MTSCDFSVLIKDEVINAILNSLRESPVQTVLKSKWKELARGLKLTENTIYELNDSASREKWGTVDYFAGILQRWICLNGNKAELNILLRTLEDCELKHFADRIKSTLHDDETRSKDKREDDVCLSTTRQISDTPDLIKSSKNPENHQEGSSQNIERETSEDEHNGLLDNTTNATRTSITEKREDTVIFQNCSFTSNTQQLCVGMQSSNSKNQHNTSSLNCIYIERIVKKVTNLIPILLGFIIVLVALFYGYKWITKQNEVKPLVLPCKNNEMNFSTCHITTITNYSHYHETAKHLSETCESLNFQLEEKKDWPLTSTIYNPSCVYSISFEGYYSTNIFESVVKQTANAIYLYINSDSKEGCQKYAQNNITSARKNIFIPLPYLKSISFNVTCQDNQAFQYLNEYILSKNLTEIIVYNYAAATDLLSAFENVLVDSDMNTVLLDAQRFMIKKELHMSTYKPYFDSNSMSGWTDESQNIKIGKEFCSRFKLIESFIITDRFFRFNDRFYVFKCIFLRQLYLKLYIETEGITDLKVKTLKNLDIVFLYLHFTKCPIQEEVQLLKINDINASYRYFVKSNCIIDHDKESYSIDLVRPPMSTR